ncbi:MAG TPA: hypothetical protein VFL16_05830 [Steroidobacteraceae bacterium]|nr:hypothetical protein [Steroidobacteraceae bacterium]
MNERPAPARLHSLCGTARRMKQKNQQKLQRSHNKIPCRPSGIWACIGAGDRSRRLASDRSPRQDSPV